MRGISKTMLRTCAGLAVAAGLVVGGAGVASAAPASSAATTTSHDFGFGCNPFARETWNLNGSNTVNAIYQGNTYSYSVTFRQSGSCLSGTMTDSYYPTTGPIHGTIYGNYVTFSFKYPAGSIQGTRTFNGYIQPRWYRQWFRQGHRWVFRWVLQLGSVSGHWSETGSENGSGLFNLSNDARSACPPWEWWIRSCLVFPY
jgi:hypothetical protein